MAYPAPNGRELAIEALLDREPNGDAYRVSRVLEEVVPMALHNRPNRVTTAALVEEAFVLQRRLTPPRPSTRRTPADHGSVRPALKDYHKRVHHDDDDDIRGGSSSNAATCSSAVTEQWLEWLQTVWSSSDKKSSSAAPGLKVLQERLFGKDDQDAKNEEKSHMDWTIEQFMGRLLLSSLSTTNADEEDNDCCEKNLSERVAALWLVITLLLANESSDPVRCGHLLSVLKFEKQERKEPYELDRTVLDYLGEAAAICQDRWVAQKPPLDVQEEAVAFSPATVTSFDENASSPVVVTDTPTSPASPDEAPIAAGEETPAGAVPAEADAVNAVRPHSSDSSSDSESSDSEHSSSSESSSSDQAPRAELFVESERSVDDETEDDTANPGLINRENANADIDRDDDSTYDTLRQALAIAVSEESGSTAQVRVIVNQSNDDAEEEPLVETPVSDGPTDATEEFPDDEVEEEKIEEAEISLPAFPPIPSRPAFSDGLQSQIEAGGANDDEEIDWQVVYDPTKEDQFAALPRSHVLVHLMRYAEALLSSSYPSYEDEEDEDDALPTVPGGMGEFLFSVSSVWDRDTSRRAASSLAGDDGSTELIFQLLATTFVTLCNRRTESLSQLWQAYKKEQRAIQGDVGTPEEGHPQGDEKEEDDPATAFAMSHVEDDDVPLSVEILQNKGMRRKAAAAAHDAATLLRTVRKHKEDLKASLLLDSTCIMTVLKFIRQFLRIKLEDWISLQDRKVADLRDLVTGSVRNRVLRSLDDLMGLTLQTLNESPLDEECFNNTLLSVPLYKEATLAWGELSPVLLDAKLRFETFTVLLEGVVMDFGSSEETFESVDCITRLPASSVHCQAHRLQVLSRRCQYDDVLTQLVSSPIPWQENQDMETIEQSKRPDASSIACFPRNLLLSIRGALGGMKLAKDDVEHFYAMLCHRIHTKVLLFDGLYAISKPETNAVSPVLAPAKKGLDSGAIHVHVNPVSRLMFDSTKCADSIAIVSNADVAANTGNGPSVNQRASKVWGAVLSTQCFSPKTGIHRWAVKLDRCERGHVFIGVSTSQASMRTYVGGDKHGWGMIGTQALWHDRRKVRGDYGGTFRTGSTIIVTLDTDAGTLSFGSWKNNHNSPSPSMDPLVHNILSPRRQAMEGGDYDDWGVAFEGLPLDARLFPAIGLYQRDDKVTLLPVDSGNYSSNGSIAALGGICFYPDLEDIADLKKREECEKIRLHNETLFNEAISFARETLDFEFARLATNPVSMKPSLIIRSLLGCLSLVPTSVPLLSTRCALSILPKLSSCLIEPDASSNRNRNPFSLEITPGDWVIRASSGSGDLEEYRVNFEPVKSESGSVVGFGGRGVGTTGKSKNGHVVIWGSLEGTSITFVEDWTDEKPKSATRSGSSEISACVVSARLSLDGMKFEGSYKNVDFASNGQIVGFCVKADQAPNAQVSWYVQKSILLSSAFNHMASAIAEDGPRDFTRLKTIHGTRKDTVEQIENNPALREAVSRPFLSSASLVHESDPLERCIQSLDDFFSFEHETGCGLHLVTSFFNGEKTEEQGLERYSAPSIMEGVTKLDSSMAPLAGGFGSLRLLCPIEYDYARKSIAAAMIYHTGCKLPDSVKSDSPEIEALKLFWRRSLQVMEDGIRLGLSKVPSMKKAEAGKNVCAVLKGLSEFLFKLQPREGFGSSSICIDEICVLYKAVDDLNDIKVIEMTLLQRTVRSVLSLSGMLGVRKILSENERVPRDALEGIIACMPQMFGSTMSLETLSHNSQPSVLSLGREAISLPLGLSGHVRLSIKESLYLVLKILVSLMGKEKTVLSRSALKVSLHLSILATFSSVSAGALSDLATDLLSQIPHVLNDYRFTALDDRPEAHGNSVVESVRLTVERDMSRAVLRAATAVAHAIVYSVGAQAPRSQETNRIRTTTEWLRLELGHLIPSLESSFRSEISCVAQECSVIEWQRWADSTSAIPAKSDASSPIQANPGLRFFWEHGTLTSPTSSRAPVKDATPSLNENGVDVRRRLESGFRNRHFAHWVHILCAVLRSKKSVGFLCTDKSWLGLLLGSVGLECTFGDNNFPTCVNLRCRDEGLLPARHRSRLTSLLYHFLSGMAPMGAVVEGLFSLAGASTVAVGIDDEERVSREAISLLRKLHNPSNPEWRQAINEAIPLLVSSVSVVRRAGVRAMFGGLLGRVEPLCRVLLKPAAASAISKEGHSSSQSKSQSSVAAAQVPAGADHVVAGLMRYSAEGGIVSSVDTKTGICEVILIPRKNGYQDDVKNDAETGNVRKHLTVRALRTQSTDLVAAEEESLVLDPSVPTATLLTSLLGSSLDSLLSAASPDSFFSSGANTTESPGTNSIMTPDEAVSDITTPADASQVSMYSTSARIFEDSDKKDDDDEPELESVEKGILRLTLDLMALKCSVLLLSDPRTLEEFLEINGSTSTLTRLLSLAWPERNGGSRMSTLVRSMRGSSVSSLSWHEAKYSLLLSSLKDIGYRSRTLKLAQPDTWSERARDLKSGAAGESKNEQSPAPLPDAQSTSRSQSANSAASQPSLRGTSGQASVGSNSEDEEEQGGGESADAQHLREAAVVQMGELGIPRPYAELALRRVGGTSIEAAVHFCLEHEAEIERLLAEEMSRQATGRDDGPGRDVPENSHLLNQLLEMGFRRRWCVEALSNTGNNVDEALTWILTNTEMLENMYNSDEEAEDENGEDDEESEEEDDTDDGEIPLSQNDEDTKADMPAVSKDWALSVVPLRLISGKATIDSKTLEVTGQPNGGFASVGMKGVLLQSGKYYYEVVLGTAGCIQVGFADSSFAGHCNAERGDGCGDSSSSFSFDGWRRLRWHATATEWGCRWQEGDVIGCFVDIDNRQISFTINGQGEEVGMGVAFSNFDFCGGLYPVVSFNRKESVRLILGGSGEPFKYPPPFGFKGVGDALPERIHERSFLLGKEGILQEADNSEEVKGFLCDYSDEDHGHELFSWSHRYYGADASVHLGSIRSRHASIGRSPSGPDAPSSVIDQHLQRLWMDDWTQREEKDSLPPPEDLACLVEKGYESAQKELAFEAFNQSTSLGITLARKMLLHVLVACKSFDPKKHFNEGECEQANMIRLVKILEVCVGARNWTGEASAMAMAAESLGLGVQVQARRVGRNDATEDILYRTGFTQVLSSILYFDGDGCQDTSGLLAAAAEGSFASDSTAALTFLRNSLQQAAISSRAFRNAVLAAVRRGVRLLALVDDSEGKQQNSDDEEGATEGEEQQGEDRESFDLSPDAKLVSFFTGLLLSESVSKAVEDSGIFQDLFSAWSIGLLSASLPWRMICAQTCASILNERPGVFGPALHESRTLARYYGRLPSSVVRRVWAERAAVPVCSRYVQAMIELLAAARRSESVSQDLPPDFTKFWSKIDVEASCPRPLVASLSLSDELSHPLDTNGIMVGNEEVWTGALEYSELDWKRPNRSTVRTLMDGGEGPPMLRVGCLVMRGPDWEKTEESANVDGYEQYESEKSARSKIIKSAPQAPETDPKELEEEAKEDANDEITEASKDDPGDDPTDSRHKKKRKKPPHPKLPLGTVVSIEPWNGVPALGRRVRWSLTGKEDVYRFGGDGGRFDIMHVETNQKRTRVVKKYPFPETSEQSASRRGFGAAKSYAVILRLPRKRRAGSVVRGILEIPDFGAGIDVDCIFNTEDDTVTLAERGVIYGQKDAGWEARFGQPSYVVGTEFKLTVSEDGDNDGSRRDPLLQELVGSTTFDVKALKNPADGGSLSAKSSLKLCRSKPAVTQDLERESSSPPPLAFDSNFHASNLSVSKDQRTVLCSTSDGRGCAFVSTGFSKGVHYWEVMLGQVSESGSIFIGCAEKPPENPPRLNRWLGWGFVNFRATYSGGSERVYGVHAHTGDVIGVLLDCDAGRISFFYDGLKYGEHIISDLGCAYENLAPLGFSAEGCGTGGHGQAAPNGFLRSSAQGFVKPKTLFPVVGLKNHGDRVTLSPIWSTTYGVDGTSILRNVLAVEELLHKYGRSSEIPGWFLRESYAEYEKWKSSSVAQIVTRGSRPYRIELDTSPFCCAQACAALGLECVLLPGDHIRLKRSFGRVLELAEDAIILGQYQLRLYYRIVAQKNEGQSLSEGAYLPHCMYESDVVDGVEFLSPSKGMGITLPRLDRFCCASPGGLEVVYSDGAIIRSDLEITDQSQNLGWIPFGTVIPQELVFDRRLNSCGILRYKVRYEEVDGYISAHIQGGSEEAIVKQVESEYEPKYATPLQCASEWHKEWASATKSHESEPDCVGIHNLEDYTKLYFEVAKDGRAAELDSMLAKTLCAISNFSESGDALECSFDEVVESLAYALSVAGRDEGFQSDTIPIPMKHAVASLFAKKELGFELPSLSVLLARASSIRALNRRARYALPWLTNRPSQEGSSVLGGTFGMGCSVEKAGRSWVPENTVSMSWIQPASVGRALRDLRNLIFSNVKREFLGEVTLATTTPTPLSHDEYELPREIRTVRINRMRAARALQSGEKIVKRKYSVFSQLQSETRNLGGAALRRGYVAKGHGGQKRAFRVKLVGEGVNDYSGPYREVFADAFSEILKTDSEGVGALGVLDATPNRAAEIGETRDLYMFSLNGQILDTVRKDFDLVDVSKEELAIREHFASLIAPRNEASREVEDALVFLGRITGTAYRHGIPVDLPLPIESVWKAIVEETPKSKADRLQELDVLAAKANRSPGLLWWQQRMLNAFVDGLGNVIPTELLPLLSAEELRDTICGSPDVDVDLLKSVVEYEGYNEGDAVVRYFWETLREFTNAERRSFLQYVWARSRLPLRAADFESPFKILRDSSNTEERADQALPSASTCFFSLTLPEYSSAEVLKEKLTYAINNVTTMETDFQTNSAEIAEGYRAL